MSAKIIQFPRSQTTSGNHQAISTRVEQLHAELDAIVKCRADNSPFVRSGTAAIDELFASAAHTHAQMLALKKHLNNTRARYS